jgi:N4-gp56 family major capsid protein
MVARALETNSFTVASGTGASTINPVIYSRMVMDFMKANLVVAPLAKVYNELLNQPGASLIIPFNAAITAAVLTESTAITPASFSYTAVTFTPAEYGCAVAITRKETVRSVQDILQEKARDMGYALAKAKDTKAITVLIAGKGNSVVANGVNVTAIASSDTLDTDDIANAIKELRVDEHNGKYLIIHPKCEVSLLKNSNFIDASNYGGREVVMNGEIGKYLGVRVLVSTQIPINGGAGTASTAYDNLLIDEDVFGIAQKMPVTLNSFYKVLEREFIMAAVEEYDVQVLRANGICLLSAYGA